jgi:hypothetical protein
MSNSFLDSRINEVKEEIIRLKLIHQYLSGAIASFETAFKNLLNSKGMRKEGLKLQRLAQEKAENGQILDIE